VYSGAAQAADAPPDLREAIAKEFTGVYRFNYLFVENGALNPRRSAVFDQSHAWRSHSRGAPESPDRSRTDQRG